MSSPPDSANLQLLFRSDTGLFKDLAGATPATLDGDAIALWQDQSGNHGDLAQATAADRPVLKLAQINGLPSVRFNGTSNFLDLSNSLLMIGRTMYAIISIPDTGVHTIICGNTSSLQWRMDGQKQRFVSASVVDIGFGTNLMALNTFTQINASWDFSNGIFRMGRAADGTVTGSNVGLNAERWIGVNDPPTLSELFKGDMAAILVYNGVHDLTTKQSVESWLQGIFGV